MTGRPVWLHSTAYSSRYAWLQEPTTTRRDVLDGTWWNGWRVRGPGWRLEDGDTVVLVSSWPGGGRLEWGVEAKNVMHLESPDWASATKAIAMWAGMDVRDVRREPYTAAKKHQPGRLHVLAWRGSKPTRIDVAKPTGLTMGRNGWLLKDAAWLKSVAGLTARAPRRTAPTKGQGRHQLAALRKVIEKRAEDVALTWCRSYGLTQLRRTGGTAAWDLEGQAPDGTVRYIEVKGLTGGLGKVDVTAGEVKAARQHGDAHLLVVVHDIELDLSTGVPRAIGGRCTPYVPWRPVAAELQETRYTWARP